MHDQQPRSAAREGAGRLRAVLFLTASYLAVEVAGGLLTGSLALIADAGHMLTDVVGVGMALLAIKFAAKPATPEKTYGYYRLEMLAALINGLLLFGVSGYILIEAYRRFSSPPEVRGLPMLGVATIGLLVNLASAYLLLEGQKVSLNLRATYLEVLSDLLGSVAAMVAGIVIITAGFELIDPIASVFIGLFILPRTWHLMGEAVHVLLEGAPKQINMTHVRDHILNTAGVNGVHDLHAWNLTSGMNVMSAHVVIAEDAAPKRVLDDLQLCLADHFDIAHSTFQIEQPDRSESEHAVH